MSPLVFMFKQNIGVYFSRSKVSIFFQKNNGCEGSCEIKDSLDMYTSVDI